MQHRGGRREHCKKDDLWSGHLQFFASCRLQVFVFCFVEFEHGHALCCLLCHIYFPLFCFFFPFLVLSWFGLLGMGEERKATCREIEREMRWNGRYCS